MSWDVSVQRFSCVYGALKDIPHTERCFPLGSQVQVQALISKYFPGTDWTRPAWGNWDSQYGSIEFNMGTDEPNDGFMMHIRASAEVVPTIVAMCRGEQWQALDGSSGILLEQVANPTDSLEQWVAYRNQIVGSA
jgi:hypothetical protein